jgi:hypothetical protein
MRKLQAITNVPQTLVDRLSEETWSKLEAIDVKARSPYLEAERIRKEIEALNKKLMAKIKRVDDQVEDAFELIGLEGKATVAERLMCFPETKARIKDRLQAWKDSPVTTMLLMGNGGVDMVRTMAELAL